jgi:8-oxo-dGTP pyrophosphatase MutT (NUDIX family)
MLWFGVGDRAFPKRPAAGLLLIAADTGRVLLTLRAEHMNDGGKWATPGGVQDDADQGSLIITAFRETREELGLEINPGDALFLQEDTNYNLRRSYTVYVAQVDREWDFDTFDLCHETEDAAWFTFEDAFALDLHPQLRPLLEEVFESINS